MWQGGGPFAPLVQTLSPFYGTPVPDLGTLVLWENPPPWPPSRGFCVLGGQKSPIWGQKSPIWGQKSPIWGQKSPIWGQKSPIWGQKSPIWGLGRGDCKPAACVTHCVARVPSLAAWVKSSDSGACLGYYTGSHCRSFGGMPEAKEGHPEPRATTTPRPSDLVLLTICSPPPPTPKRIALCRLLGPTENGFNAQAPSACVRPPLPSSPTHPLSCLRRRQRPPALVCGSGRSSGAHFAEVPGLPRGSGHTCNTPLRGGGVRPFTRAGSFSRQLFPLLFCGHSVITMCSS